MHKFRCMFPPYSTEAMASYRLSSLRVPFVRGIAVDIIAPSLPFSPSGRVRGVKGTSLSPPPSRRVCDVKQGANPPPSFSGRVRRVRESNDLSVVHPVCCCV
ncbi:unnamed protein product, partial [Sphacelaria rigidula]